MMPSVKLEGSYEQVNVNPDPTFNGSFPFSGSQTGSDFADFLIGLCEAITIRPMRRLIIFGTSMRAVLPRTAGE